MMFNNGCDGLISDRNKTTICNNGKSNRGILQSKSERGSSTHRKKNVRFSDCFNLEHVEKCNKNRRYETANNEPCTSTLELQLQKYFWLPTEDELRWLVDEKCVYLESIRWFGRTITGVVRVKNLAFEKKVEIVYTYDDWTSSYTIKGSYIESASPQEDRFSFCIFLPFLKLDLCIYFYIRYTCSGLIYWDNNCNANYKFVCHSTAASTANDSAKKNCNKSSCNPFFDSNCSVFF